MLSPQDAGEQKVFLLDSCREYVCAVHIPSKRGRLTTRPDVPTRVKVGLPRQLWGVAPGGDGFSQVITLWNGFFPLRTLREEDKIRWSIASGEAWRREERRHPVHGALHIPKEEVAFLFSFVSLLGNPVSALFLTVSTSLSSWESYSVLTFSYLI